MDFISAAAAESPVPLPPGVDEAAKKLVDSGGVLGALCLLLACACGALLWLLLRERREGNRALAEIRKDYEEHLTELTGKNDTLHEKRFSDQQQVLKSLNENTGILTVVSQVQADRTATTEKIAEAVRELTLIARGNADQLRTIQNTITANGLDIRANGAAIERLVWQGGAVSRPSPRPGEAGGGA